MRIVGGKHKGRPLSAPAGRDTRPTSDRAREAIFNVLEHGTGGSGLRGARVADVFAGTGALGLEALSRGAAHCIFVEAARPAVAALRDNLHDLGEAEHATVMQKTVAALGAPPGGPVDYAFLDAPYERGLTEQALHVLMENGWLCAGAVVMAEVAARETLSPPAPLAVLKEKTYGAARVIFLVFSG
ncbi:MAG: 16S rRNA (guanine(966)-N(2))-methyltransferase RsmD [Alphaproteobacteria bacterium]|nr:16S rRNA (guanine(966)-N(2))-methyltransferase RsmD [Alphaproteobacteria bacterium]